MPSQQAITTNNQSHKCTSSRPIPPCTGVNKIHRLTRTLALTSASTQGRVYRRSPCNLLSLYHLNSFHSNIWRHRAFNNSNQTTHHTAISNRHWPSINLSSSCSNLLNPETTKEMLNLFHQNKVVFKKLNKIPTCWVSNHPRVAAHQANNPKLIKTLCRINLNSTIQNRIFVSTTRHRVHPSIQTWSSPNPSKIKMKCPPS